MRPEFAVEGHGWNISFQRRVGKSNRGALPCLPLAPAPDRLRVLVPLAEGEAFWIAVLAEPGIVVQGHAGPHQLRVVVVSQGIGQRVLRAIDGMLLGACWAPLDASSIARAGHRDEVGIDGLTIRLESDGWSQQVAVVPATPALYESLSGFPMPHAASEEESYRGWRLP